MEWVYDDGGRKAAGYKGRASDCVCRAVAIATGKPYADVYRELNEAAARERPRKRGRTRTRGERSAARTGVFTPTMRRYLESLGWRWKPLMSIGSGCRVHLRADELPARGRLIVKVSRHVVAVIDGVVRDNHDPARDGGRCVYGYFFDPKNPPSDFPEPKPAPERPPTFRGVERLFRLH
jgi:hypothetical protein